MAEINNDPSPAAAGVPECDQNAPVPGYVSDVGKMEVDPTSTVPQATLPSDEFQLDITDAESMSIAMKYIDELKVWLKETKQDFLDLPLATKQRYHRCEKAKQELDLKVQQMNENKAAARSCSGQATLTESTPAQWSTFVSASALKNQEIDQNFAVLFERQKKAMELNHQLQDRINATECELKRVREENTDPALEISKRFKISQGIAIDAMPTLNLPGRARPSHYDPRPLAKGKSPASAGSLQWQQQYDEGWSPSVPKYPTAPLPAGWPGAQHTWVVDPGQIIGPRPTIKKNEI